MGKIALYIRISLEDDDLKENGKEESNSIRNQRKMLRNFLESKNELAGVEVAEFLDDGYTGRNFDRPGFQEMIRQCRAGDVSCIVVKDLSRLGRNYVEVGNLLEQVFPFLGVRVISVSDRYDSMELNGITGGLDIALTNLVYNLYSRDLSQKVRSAVRTRMQKGEFIGPYAIFGYKKDPDDFHRLVVDDEAAAIVRRIFGLVVKGVPRIKIVRMLNEEGVPTPSEYKAAKGCSREWGEDSKHGKWTTTAIARIIRDERYAGHMVGGKKVYEAFDSKHQIEVDKSRWIRVENTHTGIVTQEEFDTANGRMVVRKVPENKRPHSTKKNFSVIVCPYCGKCLRPRKSRDDYMYCPTGRHDKEDSLCRNVKIRQSVAEDTILELIRHQAMLVVDLEEQAKEEKSDNGKRRVAVQKLKGELAGLKSDKIRAYEDYKSGLMDRQAFIGKKADADAKITALEDRLRKEERREAFGEHDGDAEFCSNGGFRNAMKIKDYVEIRDYDKTVVAAFIKSAKVISDTEMEVTWKFQDIYEKYLR